ncbi:MAG: cobalamin-dependent protein [Candidatus Bathyarchaeota archaeon]|nr:cobalamin-dependent protein [Candidatus Bathyarchaeota archaeon]
MPMVEKKSSKVILINPPFLKGSFRHQLYIPMGLAYLAAFLEEKGHQAKIIDCLALNIDHEKLKSEISSFEPDIVGITSITPLTRSTLLAAKAAKEALPDVTVVLGGPHATFMDEQIIAEETAVDFVVRGEGELTLLEIAENIHSSRKIDSIEGITFRRNKQVIRTPNRPFIQDLDKLPKPAYDHFELDRYRLFGKKLLPVITSRGCPFQCAFCVATRMFGKAYRMRSAENVLDELEWLKNVHGAEAFTFYDDTLTFDKNRLLKICDGMKKRQINLPWDCQTRVDQVSQEILNQMKSAGCQQVFFGVESGCQQILDSVNKKTSIEQNEKAIKMAKQAGLFVTISLMIGYPGETRETLKQTLDFVKRSKPDDVYVCVATPYPGTVLRNIVEKNGWKMSSNIDLYDTMTPVFENPDLPSDEIIKFRRDFYDSFYSPSYILRQALKRNPYSRMMARTALNHILWRFRSRRKIERTAQT